MNEIKKCPYCGEEIMASAIKCRHCGEWLVDENVVKQLHDSAVPKVQVPVNETKPFTTGAAISLGIIALLFYSIIPVILMIVAYHTVPSEEKQDQRILEDVRDCVADNTQSIANAFGSEVGSFASLILSLSTTDEGINRTFLENNSIKVDRHWFWSVGKIHNRIYPSGKTVSFGMFGIVFPFVSWNDFVLSDEEKMSKDDSSKSNT